MRHFVSAFDEKKMVLTLHECIQLFKDKARLFQHIEQPHMCHVKTFSQINSCLWFILWIAKSS